MDHAIDVWASWFAESAGLRTAVGFAHIGGIVFAAGSALVADREVLGTPRADGLGPETARRLAAAHRWVLGGLIAVVLSGVLLFAADMEAYVVSPWFWTKMTGVAVLVVNGAVVRLAARAAAAGDVRAWSRLRAAAVVSLVAWLSVVLLGVALPHVV